MRARNVVEHMRLNMKVTDAEYQADASKVFSIIPLNSELILGNWSESLRRPCMLEWRCVKSTLAKKRLGWEDWGYADVNYVAALG